MSDATWTCIGCGATTSPGQRLCPVCRALKDAPKLAELSVTAPTAPPQPLPATPEPGPGSTPAHKKRGPRPAEAMKGYTRGPRKSRTEWEQIARAYVQGLDDGYRILAREYKVSLRQIKRRSKAGGWRAQRAAYRAQLRAKTFGFALEPDEPTFALKASDVGAATLLRSWANNVELHGGDLARAEAVRAAADAFEAWNRSRKKALRGR